jgi:oligopeptide transport system substrate-binding protein
VNRLILVIVGLMAALIVGCGAVAVVLVVSGGDNDDSGASGDTLRTIGPDPITLDPHIAQDAGSAVYIVEIFGGLLTLDPELQIQPDLATEIPTIENAGKVVNEDGTATYTFQLRENVTFHDRSPVTADIVKCSLERAANPATRSLVSEFFLGDIVGIDDVLDGDTTGLSGVAVVDPRTVTITIKSDVASFPYKLTYPTAYVVDPAQVGGTCGGREYGDGDDDWTRHPNGTGPYELDQWQPGEEIRLVANEAYHLGAGSVKNIRLLLAGGGITAYEQDEVDLTGVPIDDLERVRDPADPLNEDYRTGTQLAIDYIGLNVNTPPFDDVNVRKAFAMAIDKDQINTAIFHEALPVANKLIMPDMPAYSESVQGLTFDAAAARQLLNESSYGGAEELPEITFAESGQGATSSSATGAIVDMWRENLGVEVQIAQAQPATFFQDIADGRYQAFHLGWIMDYPNEENLLNIHFDSDSPNNDTFYSNPEVDDLLRQAQTEPDPATRNQLYQQAEQLILDDAPWIPLFFSRYHLLAKPYVQNYEVPPAVVPRFRFVTLLPR